MRARTIFAGFAIAGAGLVFLVILFRDEPPGISANEREERAASGEDRGAPAPDVGREEERVSETEEESETPVSYRLVSSRRLGYGDGPGEVGIVDDPGHDIAGPESFSVDANGNFVVCDTVNQRIQIVNTESGNHSEVALPADAVPADLAVHASGTLLAYDYAGRLDHYDEAGNRIGSVAVDAARWDVRMELHIDGAEVRMRDVDQREHLLGIVEDGRLREITREELDRNGTVSGIRGASGRTYRTELERWSRGRVEVAHLDSVTRTEVDLEVPGIVSLRYLNEDREGNFYMQVERVEAEEVFLEVHRFDAAGEPEAVVGIPENDYHHWTVKLLSVDDRGHIYQALPQPDGMRLNVFAPEVAGGG